MPNSGFHIGFFFQGILRSCQHFYELSYSSHSRSSIYTDSAGHMVQCEARTVLQQQPGVVDDEVVVVVVVERPSDHVLLFHVLCCARSIVSACVAW